MNRSFRDAVLHRRSHYSLTNSATISDSEIQNILDFVLRNVPSAFNSQTTRIVLLLGNNHRELWDIVMRSLRCLTSARAFEATEAKINSFAAGYGTILFFEEQTIVTALQEKFPLYADNFPLWSIQTSGMHQFAVWTMLEDAGLAASLQHYNPLIDDAVRAEWALPSSWRLMAEMPFGTPTPDANAKLPVKTVEPIANRLRIFK